MKSNKDLDLGILDQEINQEQTFFEEGGQPHIRFDSVGMVFQPFRGEMLTALDGISLDIHRNEFVSIVGASGCGKTTLLRIAAGLVNPTSGSVSLDGLTPREFRRNGIGMVFQSPVLLPWRTVKENILLPIEFFGESRDRYMDEADRLLEMTKLSEFSNSQVYELSGGMQQRVAICRSLVYSPDILLMDEPFGALDALTREEMWIELHRIWEETGGTVLFVTHNITEAVILSHRVVVLTPRPGRMRRVVQVPLPMPRTVDMEFRKEFAECKEEIRSAIFEQ